MKRIRVIYLGITARLKLQVCPCKSNTFITGRLQNDAAAPDSRRRRMHSEALNRRHVIFNRIVCSWVTLKRLCIIYLYVVSSVVQTRRVTLISDSGFPFLQYEEWRMYPPLMVFALWTGLLCELINIQVFAAENSVFWVRFLPLWVRGVHEPTDQQEDDF